MVRETKIELLGRNDKSEGEGFKAKCFVSAVKHGDDSIILKPRHSWLFQQKNDPKFISKLSLESRITLSFWNSFPKAPTSTLLKIYGQC